MGLIDSLLGGIFGELGKKIGSWIPDKDQKLLLEKERLERKRNEMLKRKNLSSDDSYNLHIILDRLREIRKYFETRQK